MNGILRGAADRIDRPLSRGTNQSGMRDSNERLALSLVRRHGALAKSELAAMTGLSAQTVSVIMRKLEGEALLLRGAPQRGRVGQPSVPMSLNPDGALFFGVKIGRRSADLVLIDFLGRPRAMQSRRYDYPVPDDVVAFVRGGVDKISAGLAPALRGRIAGLGIAMPFELWKWADTAGAPGGSMDGWRSLDIRAEIAALVPFPIYMQNDATAACGAELLFGTHAPLSECLYFYLGAFIGGGVVMGGALYAGASGNAGALGSMPVPGRNGRVEQLIDRASIATLEGALLKAGRDAGHLWTSPEDWGDLGEALDVWVADAARALAYAIVAAGSVIDFEVAIVDGWMPVTVRQRIVAGTLSELDALDRAGVAEGIVLPKVREGKVGLHARAIGGAALPLADRFLTGGLAGAIAP